MGIYNVMFTGGLILSILFLVASIVLFFVLDVRKAFGVVTGKTQKKAIEEIRQGGRAQAEKKTRGNRGLRGSRILVRDIDVTDADKKSQSLTKTDSNLKHSSGRNTDVSDSLAEKAAADARLAAARAAASKIRNPEKLDEESTEVLSYNEMNGKSGRDTSEEATSILEEEQPTDVLSSTEDEQEYKEDYNDNLGAAEESTDVLTAQSSTESIVESIMKDRGPIDYRPSDEEETTDVLKSSSAGIYNEDSLSDEETGLYDDEIDQEEMTDVLKADNQNLSETDVHGTYDPDVTSVLIADMVPGENSVRKERHGDLPEINVLYSETIVHTTESL